MKTEIYSSSADETYKIGLDLGREAKKGTVITLDGDLGAGKTVMAKGIAAGLGITEAVTSPTFIIMRHYDSGRLPMYHFDVYRIEDIDEMIAVGYDEYIDSDGVCVIDWSEMIEELIPEDAIRITIERVSGDEDDLRKITVVRG